jgi:hypothetical protein
MRGAPRIAIVALLLALVSSCGGGSGGSGGHAFGPASFAGEFRLAAFEGLSGATEDMTASWGTVTGDGGSECLFVLTVNNEGTVSSPPSLPATYSVDAGGAIEVGQLAGHLCLGGEVAVLGSALGGVPMVMALARPPTSPMSDASLVGLYRVVLYDHGPTADMTSIVGWFVFDGVGGLSFSITAANAEGTIASILVSVNGTYSVQADGTLTVTLPLFEAEGTVLEGGELGFAAGGTTGGEIPVVLAFVKAASSASLSTFSGSYAVVSFELDAVLGLISVTGLADADGSGAVTRTGTANTDGVIAASPALPGTYTVSPDGTVHLTAAGDTFLGGISQDGQFVVLGGGTNAGSNPTFQVYVRR